MTSLRILPLALSLLVLSASACEKKERVPTDPGFSGGAQVAAGQTGSGGSGGAGDGGAAATGGNTGSGGATSGAGGAGGEANASPNCACLVDQAADPACSSCLGFRAVDDCAAANEACQNDKSCPLVDVCVLNGGCQTAACLQICRDEGTEVGLALFDALYACACDSCAAECSGSDCT